MAKQVIAIGSDHAGWHMKEEIAALLRDLGHRVKDYSLPSPDPVDYPDIANQLAGDVSRGRIRRGILICGTGIGMAITANRHRGVRATPVTEPYSARMSREHNNSNILVLGSRVTGPELIFEIVRVWLSTAFQKGRHARRLAKLL